MTFKTRRMIMGCALCLAGLMGWMGNALGESAARAAIPIPASAATTESPVLSGGLPLSLRTTQLVVPAADILDENDQGRAAERAELTTPAATQEREASQTAFEHLDTRSAADVDRAAFPTLGEPSSSVLTRLQRDDEVKFTTNYSAIVALRNGRHAAIDSMTPLAVETHTGSRVPVDLTLHKVAGGFEPVTASVPVQIPADLAAGASMLGAHIGLTPLTAAGRPAEATGTQSDGSSVLYGNTAQNTDDVITAGPAGFSLDAILRGQNSPRKLCFRATVPQGASLRSAPDGSLTIRSGSRTLASILASRAHDADGVPVAVRMTHAGNAVCVTIAQDTTSDRFPILVDPTVVDTEFFEPGNWVFGTDNTGAFHAEVLVNPEREKPWAGLEIRGVGKYSSGQFAFFEYPTQGKSHIYEFSAKTKTGVPGAIRSGIRIEDPSNVREGAEVGLSGEQENTVCPANCDAEAVTAQNGHNAAFVQASTSEAGEAAGAVVTLLSASVAIDQEEPPSVAADTDPTITETTLEENKEGSATRPNLLASSGWVATTAPSVQQDAIGVKAFDSGVGVSKWEMTVAGVMHARDEACSNVGEFGSGHVQCVECRDWATAACNGQTPNDPMDLTLAEIREWWGELPEGEDHLESVVTDSVGLKSTPTSATLKVDNQAPHGLSLTGLPSTGEVSDSNGAIKLHGTATDGSGSTPSSGVAALTLTVDGHQLSGSFTGCTKGPCSGSGEWTLNPEEVGAGKHLITLTARDGAGNEASERYEVVFHHATPVDLGPGAVNPVTGEFALTATDASVAAPGGSLALTRVFSSRHLTAGAEGPVGPQWSMSGGALQSMKKLQGGLLVLTDSAGRETVFVSNGKGTYTPPRGDGTLSVAEKAYAGGTEYELVSGGAATTFRHTAGSPENVWLPALAEGTGGNAAISYSYEAIGGVPELSEELAPVPAGVSCSPTLTRGCRALLLKYATTTTATGLNQSQWGSYKGSLEEVALKTWEPKAQAMVTKPVARYEWDNQGELRTEWNPEISPTVKTTYGYDAEHRLTAITEGGRQPWLLGYGTSATDVRPGRLIEVTRPAAATPAGDGSVPANTAAPTVSGTPAVGSKLTVAANGTWSNSPLVYSYQWTTCNAAGTGCALIPGATNATYYPSTADQGHTLVAQVVAANGTGSTLASTAATATVASGTPNNTPPAPPKPGTSSLWTIDYGVPVSGAGAPVAMGSSEVAAWAQTDDPAEATAIFPPDQPEGWPAESYKRATLHYLDSRDRGVNLATPGGGIATTEYNEYDDVTRTLSADNRQRALNAGARSAEVSRTLDSEASYEREGAELTTSTGPEHEIQLASGARVQARSITHYRYDEGAPSEGGPYELPTKVTTSALVGGKEEATQTTVTSYSGQGGLGWRLHKPTATVIEPEGSHLEHSTVYDPETGAVTEARAPGGAALAEEQYSFVFEYGKIGPEPGQFKSPTSIVITRTGEVDVLDSKNDRVQRSNREGKYLGAWGKLGKASGQVKNPEGMASDAAGHIWIADTGNDRVEEFTAEGELIAIVGAGGELNKPTGVAVDAADDIWVVDQKNNRVVEYAPQQHEGETTGYAIVRTLGTGSAGSGEGQFNKPTDVVVSPEGYVYISDTGNNRIQKFTDTGTYAGIIGKKGTGAGEFKSPTSLAFANGRLDVADTGNGRVEVFSAEGSYLHAIGVKGTKPGTLDEPEGVAIDREGDVWIDNSGQDAISEWTPEQSVNNRQTVYYSSAADYYHPSCGEHPEWSGLACQEQPARQPGGTLPKLPTTTRTYNLWDAPETITNTAGTAVRETTISTDGAGRVTKTATTANSGAAVPAVSDAYNSSTGELDELTATVEGKPERIVKETNSLGELTSYTDADENTSTFSWDVDGRPEHTNDGKGTQTLSYDPTSGALDRLEDSAAGTFTAAHDLEGDITEIGYPNGMTAKKTLDPTGTLTGVEYVKTTHCTTGCTWFSDTVTVNNDGQWVAQASTFGNETYGHDKAGQVGEVTETPTGQGCTTRLYSYEEAEGNRTSVTTRPPGSEGKCASEGGSTEAHSYDEASRLTDTGVSYDPFGNITTLPATDAGGAELRSAYYDDDQLAEQAQSGETIGYKLDPAGRTREAIATGRAASDTIMHYMGAGDTPAWTLEPTSGHWTRDIPGIDGRLAAVQSSTEPTELEIVNLHGDVVATASLSETETKLKPATRTNEFGVPQGEAKRGFGWLGADARSTELSSGVIAMGARSYVPQLGRFLQEDPIEGGSANAYAYTFGEPLSTADPTGEYTASVEGWALAGAGRVAGEAIEAREAELAAIRAAEEAAARQHAEEQALAAAAERSAFCSSGADFWELETAGCIPSLNEVLAARQGPGEAPPPEWGGGCSGTNACASSFLGITIDLGGIGEFWEKVKGGYRLLKEYIIRPVEEDLKENSTVCKTLNYAVAAGSYFVPDSKFAKALGVALGVGGTYAC